MAQQQGNQPGLRVQLCIAAAQRVGFSLERRKRALQAAAGGAQEMPGQAKRVVASGAPMLHACRCRLPRSSR
jgi:hypothetical protein